MRKRSITLLITGTLLLCTRLASPLVSYDKGQRQILGVQLLQDSEDETAYYYLPQFPRLATRDDGSFELLCVKYIGAGDVASGGLFHALVEFTLPPEVVEALEKELEKEVAGARIIGPVPLKPTEEGEEGMGSFELVSALLSDRGEGGFTRTVVTSGNAPVTLGSKAVVAAILAPEGATLLWDSFSGPTSDVSVTVNAYYEALVEGYNARVSAEVSTVYQHFSRVLNRQKDYTRRQLRKIVDELQRTGGLDVEVVDRSRGLGIDASSMEGILDVVTDKLIELMFDAEAGWSADPERETAVEANQIQGRQKRGWFSRVFGGAQDTKYFTDDQYVLKKREDIKRNAFSINLSKSTTIRVPVSTSGNLGGLYDALEDDERYFRVVNLDDPDFELRQVHFQVDGAYVDSFKDAINFVSVNFRKTYPGKSAVTKTLHFDHDDIQAGKVRQSIEFPRLGVSGPEWTEYEYQVRWSLRDGPTLSLPAQNDAWIRSRDAAVSLRPPLQKRVVEIDADRELFANEGMATALVEFATVIAGKPKLLRRLTLRASDAETTSLLSLYHDTDAPLAFRVSWYAPTGTIQENMQILESDYLYLVPPVPGGGF